ncbi:MULTISPECIES: type II toxin-antitoxin system RelB/DinJ family antitoxin [Cupriavidus]|uniref:Type II toxin-antitoxin system RelB/DinJ family antitoxin n=1 Tax=Cupriavidus oxalaticus TaxID=96344 RepID=A0A4V1BY57_9BURK|nr:MULTISPECIES: type II toxin-antitoxin system RelB/DinJ family antitoxin [Cupriavidus]MBF6990408.1 type II toxin-antitoxin system RelB/DinJ family antitoxin [Cupriavidus sp. IK-TO18]QBY50662.1 type II toxin-antitoxin system RelB/DinJ family antitoxin [Cupriavidus oxalaticus]TDF64417.1 type II toxin-antitoxin system RelB/DinJ family antitoxin [Cupriavidus sp. L7L]
MSASTFVRARIDQQIKEEAAAVLEAMGLTVSDAVRMLLTRIALEQALPSGLITPNPATIAALKEARAGGLRKFGSVAALMADLNDEDE